MSKKLLSAETMVPPDDSDRGVYTPLKKDEFSSEGYAVKDMTETGGYGKDLEQEHVDKENIYGGNVYGEQSETGKTSSGTDIPVGKDFPGEAGKDFGDTDAGKKDRMADIKDNIREMFGIKKKDDDVHAHESTAQT